MKKIQSLSKYFLVMVALMQIMFMTTIPYALADIEPGDGQNIGTGTGSDHSSLGTDSSADGSSSDTSSSSENSQTCPSKLTCESLVDPTKLQCHVITILEERINAPGKNNEQAEGNTGDQGILNCFRKTTCTVKDGVKSCDKTEYTPSCKTSDTVLCQAVQVLYAKSGANLLYSYIGLIYRWAAGTVGIVSVLYLVIGGIQMTMAQGDQGKYEKAKERITNSLTGLVLLFLSAIILYSINPNFFTR